MKKYFHKLPQKEIDKLISEEKTVQYIMDNYKQPNWCTYPKALSMTWGCWSLCDLEKNGLRTRISKKYCGTCECFKK